MASSSTLCRHCEPCRPCANDLPIKITTAIYFRKDICKIIIKITPAMSCSYRLLIAAE